jgi:dynein heavy chain 2, cytosolic
MKSANDQKTDMMMLKSKTAENGEILKQRKLEIEQELSLVEPLLKEASVAVGSIKTEALAEIRSLRAPPETIRDILEGVLRLMGIRDTSWNSMKSFLAKRGVKEDIRSLNPSLISPENCAEVERLIEMKTESFDFRNAKRASAAAAPLSSWVVACVKYSKVVQSIRPLEREQQELERNLHATENQMKSLSNGIDDVNVKVKELSEQLNGYTQEAAVLEIKLEDTRNTLKSTEILVEKLSSEYSNWTEELESIHSELKDLDKQSMVIALCLTHFSHILEEEKSRFVVDINETLHLKFDLKENLYTDQDKLVWESMGLSNDKQSVENAAMLVKVS